MKKITLVILSFVFAACGSRATPTAQIPAVTQTPTTSPDTPPAENYQPPAHLIGIRQSEGSAQFYNKETNQPFIPRGVNYFILKPKNQIYLNLTLGEGHYDHNQVEEDFRTLASSGFNTVRIFLDSCGQLPECIGKTGGQGLNPAYMDNIADIMATAKKEGIFILFTSNDLPDGGRYWEISAQGESSQFAGYRNAHYLTPPGVESARIYWGDLLSELAKRNAPFEIILGWSLLNEQWYFNDQPPFSLNSGTVAAANGQSYDMADPAQKMALAADSMLYYIQEVKSVILEHDPDALVTMGFFEPDFPNPSRIGDFRLVVTAPLLADAALDFFDFHAYPGGDLTIEQYAQNYGMENFQAKPIIMGEAGAFIDRYPIEEAAARAAQKWIADSCLFGFDGWLYWGYYQAPLAIGDATWGFADGEHLLVSVLSPNAQPDPCSPTPLPGGNLALGKSVRVSRFLAGEPPENVIDGGPKQWGAGDYPSQWIEIDLGGPAVIKEIRLWVAQYPAGTTVHQIWVRGPSGESHMVHQFEGTTQEGDVLSFAPDTPLSGIQFIRIRTTQSPSWVAWQEIEIFGDLE